jgi:hypothetical protein
MSEEIKEDFLEVDSKIPGQNYVCLSFVSPEKILKQKELFFTTKFLDYLINDSDQLVQNIREKMLNKDVTTNYDNVKQLYEDWKYLKNDDIEHEFYELNDYKTTMRGIKVRGVYDSYKEATVRAQVLRRKDPSFNVFVGQVGYWLPWDPECESVPEQEYQEGQLNELVKKYKENLDNRDNLYDQMKNERIEKAKKEVNAKKELLKAQNTMNIPENTEAEDIKNIEQLRSIVDESDKLYYDNLKNNEAPSTEQEPLNVDSKSESVNENNQETNTNNFVSETMSNLENSDPWLDRQKKEE